MSHQTAKVQIGKESTKGTAVAATTIWRGPAGKISDDRTIHFPEENIGNIPGKDRTTTPKLDASVPFPETEATFEQLGYILGSAIQAESGVQDGAGTGYVYTFDPPVDSAPALSYINSRTIETGDSQQAEEMEYAIVQDLTIRGRMGYPVMVSANWFGRQAAQSTFTGALSLPTVEEILASKGKLYIDDEGGTIGSTQIAGELLEWEFNYTSGWIPRHNGDGQLYFTKAKFTKPVARLNLVFEHETAAIAEKEDWRSENARLMRILIEGSALGTPGTTYTYKTFQIDAAGKFETFDPFQESEGLSTIAGSVRIQDNDTADLYLQLLLVNELTALP